MSQSKIKQWILTNWKSIILLIISLVCFGVLWFLAIYYGFIAITAKDTILKSLIDAEATILGFFGLIVIYALNSFDNRIDRIEQQLFDVKEKYLDMKDNPKAIIKIGKAKVTRLNKQLSRVGEQKRIMINNAVATGSFLVVSLLLSISALGITDGNNAFFHCCIAIYLFFGSIVMILGMLYSFSRSS